MTFPLDIQFVKKAESKLGRKLPLSFVARMCRNNGGDVRSGTDCWSLFPIFDDSDRKRLKRTCNDIVRETNYARTRAGFPNDALAIGSNNCGDLLVFLADPSSNNFGDAVYWWDHETDELNKIADDFLDL